MANQKTEGTTITFKLSARQAMWDPNISGFNGLSAININPVTEGVVNSEENPRLYDAVKLGIRAGTLVEVDIKEQKRSGKKSSNEDKKDNGVSVYSQDEYAKSIMSEKTQAQLVEFIQSNTDINFLQILAELEMNGQNNTGTVRRQILNDIKSRIKELDVPMV